MKFLILAFAALALASCFSPWQGDEGSLRIHIGEDEEPVTEIKGIPVEDFKHIITLSDGPGAEQTQTVNGIGAARFFVTPGVWTITIKAYVAERGTIEDAPLASGSTRLAVKPGPNDVVFIEMDWRSWTVRFDSNGGTAVPAQPVYDGEKASKPQDIAREGHIFGGWYADNAIFEHEWNFDTAVSRNITLYAKWTPNRTFTINPPAMVDAAPLILNQVISLSGDNGHKTVTVTLDNPGQYSSIAWHIAGTNVSGNGASFTLDSENPIYGSVGEYNLTVEVWKDGRPYNKTVIFTVVQ